LRIEVVEQGGAAEDGASEFTELIAGQSGAVQFVIGRTKVYPIDLDRRRTGGEQQQNSRRKA
jgi:2-keto-4-pentenoate hydratase